MPRASCEILSATRSFRRPLPPARQLGSPGANRRRVPDMVRRSRAEVDQERERVISNPPPIPSFLPPSLSSLSTFRRATAGNVTSAETSHADHSILRALQTGKEAAEGKMDPHPRGGAEAMDTRLDTSGLGVSEPLSLPPRAPPSCKALTCECVRACCRVRGYPHQPDDTLPRSFKSSSQHVALSEAGFSGPPPTPSSRGNRNGVRRDEFKDGSSGAVTPGNSTMGGAGGGGAHQAHGNGHRGVRPGVNQLVLKFTTLSDGNERASFYVDDSGGTIGRGEENTVSVPSDTTLSPVRARDHLTWWCAPSRWRDPC